MNIILGTHSGRAAAISLEETETFQHFSLMDLQKGTNPVPANLGG